MILTIIIEHRWLHNVHSDKDLLLFDPDIAFKSHPKISISGRQSYYFPMAMLSDLFKIDTISFHMGLHLIISYH